MSGITHVLNLAKQALLTHQSSIQVAGHNVANVDTPGYTRQKINIEANTAFPSAAGIMGGGVLADGIARQYDQFMVERIAKQSSLMGNLEAQQQALRVVEPIFNEARGLALNDLMNQFWNSWQELSDNPETLGARQNVLQHGQLLADHMGTMSSEIIRARSDIGTNLKSAINDINSISDQIAQLNSKISTAEVGRAEANDLRDRRDNLVKELSTLVDVNHFADKRGAYSVMLTDGHPLVEGDESWQVDWVDDQLHWIGTDATGRTNSRALNSEKLGGKIGGWLEIHGELAAGDPNNYAGRLDALANALIRELNQLHSSGVGTVRFDDELVGAELGAQTSVATGQVAANTANRNIPAGSIKVNGLDIGQIRGAAPVNGRATEKAANAVNAINQADAGVTARLTTQVAGGEVDTTDLAEDDTVSFTINGVEVSYTVDLSDPYTDPETGDTDDAATTFAKRLTEKINEALDEHNQDADNLSPEIAIEAVVGDGENGGPENSLIFRNTRAGDESSITIDNLHGFDADDDPMELDKLAKALGFEGQNIIGETHVADAQHNTGEITLFSDQSYTIEAGVDDNILAQLGLHDVDQRGDQRGDGQLRVVPGDGPDDAFLLNGFKHGEQLDTEDGSFSIWLYHDDGSLALPQPVEVSLERAYTARDAATAINNAIIEAGGTDDPEAEHPIPWLQAKFDPKEQRFTLTPNDGYQFALDGARQEDGTHGRDTSNFLQVAGLNTFFTGHSAGTIGINQTVADDLNYLAAGQVRDDGQVYAGDNTNALEISNLQHKDNIKFEGGRTNSLNGFYNSLIGDIGNKGRTIGRNLEFNELVLNQMNEMRDAVSGVSLDEEMANLIKFQHAYTAAARMISMSDEMLVTLLDTVR